MDNLFFIRFLWSSLILSLIMLIIIGAKRLFQNHISVKWQYYIWMIFLIMLMIPFIPQELLNFGSIIGWNMSHRDLNNQVVNNINLLNAGNQNIFQGEVGLQDFTLSMKPSTLTYLNIIGISLWGMGMVVCVGVMTFAYLSMRKIKNSTKPIKNKEIEALFQECKRELNINRSLVLGQSSHVNVPIVFGLLKTYIILPEEVINKLSLEDMRYIILHELNHYKKKDIWINYAMCFYKVVYWFNPCVHWAFNIMKTDREIACDTEVLNLLDESNYIDYGRTIINFIEILSESRSLAMVTSMGGSKKQVMKRIKHIASFKKENKFLQVKSLLIFGLITTIALSQVPMVAVMAYENNKYQFESDKVIEEDLSSYFDGVEGSFVLYDLQNDQYKLYNKANSIKRVSPNSTYKIYSALIGLETGVIQPDRSTLKWDGEESVYKEWNHDQDLNSAIAHSVSWYFQDLDQMVGKEKLQYYFDEIQYGNSNLMGGISRYWTESSLKISPIEQVELLKDFYENNMIFKDENINTVKEAIKISEKDGITLSGKTGSGMVNGKAINGWFIGYVENHGETYIFATNIQAEDGVDGGVAAEITLSILEDKQLY